MSSFAQSLARRLLNDDSLLRAPPSLPTAPFPHLSPSSLSYSNPLGFFGMSFFNKLLNQAAEALRSPAPTTEGAPFQFDDSAASTIIVEPPSKILEHAVRALQGMGEGNLGTKLEVSSVQGESMGTSDWEVESS